MMRRPGLLAGLALHVAGASLQHEGARAVELRLNASVPLALTAPNFLGANIDTASLYQGTEPHRLDFLDPGLLALGRAFAGTGDDAGWGAGAASPGNPRQLSPGNGHGGSQRVVIDEHGWTA